MFSRLRIGLGIAALACGFACYTPSVPLPPPVTTALTFQPASMPGYVVMQGVAEPRHANARFYILDRVSGDGVITTATASGAFTTDPFKAATGDLVQISYENSAGESSQVICSPLEPNQHPIGNGCN
jgi:hypothetical protein